MMAEGIRKVISGSRATPSDANKMKGQNTVHSGKSEKVRGQTTSNGKSNR